jgi:hypothetical protein
MIVITGRRLMGRVEQYEGSFVVTQFLHLNYVPLVPLGSYLVLESDVGPARPVSGPTIRRSVPIKLHALSVLAGYLRVWGTMGSLFCIVGAMIASGGAMLVFLAMAGVLGGLALWAWTALGRLSAEAIAQRRAYGALTHEHVDPALLFRNDNAFRGTLHANVAQGAQGMMGTSYRTVLDPKRDWAEIALDPLVRDRAFLQACLTLARIEWGRAEGPTRGAYATHHKRIWEKLQTVDPQLPV